MHFSVNWYFTIWFFFLPTCETNEQFTLKIFFYTLSFPALEGEVQMTDIDSTKPYTRSQKVQNRLTLIHKSV